MMDAIDIVGDFGTGAFGDTIILQPRSRPSLAWLRRLFLTLADSRDVIRLDLEPGVQLFSISRLELRLSADPPTKNLVRDSSSAEPSFTWSCTSDQWRAAAAALEGLLESDRPGHQYLTHEGIDDALVEVTFGEPEVRVPAGGASN